MSPHKMFLLFFGCSALVSAIVFLKEADQVASMMQAFTIAGVVIAVVLFVTRKYWQNARRVSSS